MKKLTSTVLACALAAPGFALAADETDDITMEVIEGETPEAVTQQIELPESASEEGATNAAAGIESANQAREQAREMASENVEAAMERRREMQEQQQQIREQREEMQEQQDAMDATEYRPAQ